MHKHHLLTALFGLILLVPFHAQAQDGSMRFQMPVDCDIGVNCWAVNYVDTDATENAADYKCGNRSYQNHKGTDFGILDRATMERGVKVLAAADGTIARFRDNQQDWPAIDTEETKAKREELMANNKGCGNGVYINHPGGVSTIYCHLKQDSITVETGQKVKAGTPIAEIGRSGFSEFPHLHFGIYKDGAVFDPFSGRKYEEGCNLSGKPLWNNDVIIPYKQISLYAAGFKGSVPDFDGLKIDASSVRSIPITTEVFTFWAGFYGASKGDKIHMRILDPNGKIFVKQNIIQQEDKARQFYFVGRKIVDGMLQKGEYTGLITIQTTGQTGTQTETIARTVMIQ